MTENNENNKIKCSKKMFNPFAEESNRLFCSETTNILDLGNVKYPFFIDIVDKMYSNNWLPNKVGSMSEDKYQYQNSLNTADKEAFDTILSFLIFLDSVQTNNLPNISEYITLPEVVYALSRQTWEEALHSRSYGYILINAVGQENITKIVHKYKENEILLNRNKSIAGLYDECKEDKSPKNFLRDLVANYLLEGLYFYNGFQFFHNLADRGLMVATDIQIKYIQRDELIHTVIFKEILKIFKQENPEYFDKELIYDMFKEAVEIEQEFSIDLFGDKIPGISKQSITDYTFYLANRRLKDIGLKEIFPETKNPYVHLEKIAAVDDETSNRINNFETTSITYKDPTILKGWDKI